MDKKHDLPYMPFYYGDWMKAPEIRALDLNVRMIWFEMMGLMWESTERGYLTINSNSVSTSVISRMIGVPITELEEALQQLEKYNVHSKREDGAIYSRRMVRDEQIRLNKSKAGQEGMKKRYAKKAKSVITETITPTITPVISTHITEYDNDIDI